MTKIGTGYIDVDADFGPFWDRIQRETGQLGPQFRGAGQSAASEFSRSFDRGLQDAGSLNSLARDLDRSRSKLKAIGAAAGADISDGIARGLDPARQKLNAFERDGAASFKSVGESAKRANGELRQLYSDIGRQNISRALGDAGQGNLRKLGDEVGRTRGRLGSLSAGFEYLGRSKKKTDTLIEKNVGTFGRLGGSIGGTTGAVGGASAMLGGLKIALVALIPIAIAFSGAAIAVGSALLPLAGLAAAAANGLGAAAQGLSVFKLATAGIVGALKEQTTAHAAAAGGATSNAGAQRAAARAIQSAQDGVRQATDALNEAHRTQKAAVDALAPALTEARVRLRDLRDAVLESDVALKNATWSAKDAKTALAALLAGPSPRELASAHQAVTDALRGEDSAAQSLTDAYKTLNDLLQPAAALDVADAQDAVADALRGQDRAQLALNKTIADSNAILADPGATDEQKARARLDLADAENAVGDAARQTQHAKETLAKLEAGPDQDQVAAARRRVSDAEYDVAQAAMGTADARAQLATVEAPASADDIARARDTVAEAELGVAEATRDRTRAVRELTAAEAHGIGGSDEVLAAREAIRVADKGVTDAERDVRRATQALTDAQAASSDATAGAAAAAQNLNEKLNSLPPAAQAFVRQLIAMKPKLDELRNTAAAGFFPGATEGLNAAMGSFDSINKVVGETSTVLGEAARKSGELVGSPAFGKDIETIGGNNARVIDTLGEALRHVISALRHVIVAAGPLTQWLADVANNWARNAAEAAKAGRESGKLADFFDRTRAVAERLASILGHLASGLLGVGHVGQISGNQILKSIDAAATRFDEWANSAKGQTALHEFFQRAKDLAAALIPVLGNVAGAIAVLALKTLPLTTALRLFGPYADEATVAFVAFKLAMIGVNIVGKLFAGMAAIAAFATGGWTTAFWALDAAMAALPLFAIVAGIAAVAAGLIYAYHHSETFRNIVDGAFRVVSTAFGWLLQAAKDAFGWLTDHWVLVASILTGPIGAAVIQIATHWDEIKAGAVTAWNAISGFLTSIWDTISGAAVTVFTAIRDFIADRWTDITTAASGAWTLISGALSTAWNTIKSIATTLWDAIREAILTPIRAARDTIGDVVTGIQSRLSSAWDTIKSSAATAWDTVRDAVLTPIRAARDTIGDVVTGIANRVQTGWDTITTAAGNFAGDIKDKIVDGVKGGLNALIGFVRDVVHTINGLLGAVGLPKIPEPKELATGGTLDPDAGGAAGAAAGKRAFARGGAFGMTGGLVDQPIAIMGEEAPTHPEFVIPTNPAYRARAQMLAAAASRAVGVPGFALGGIFDKVAGAASGLWDLVEGGAAAITGKLPGVGGLPDWVKGVGTFIRDRIGDWVSDQVKGLFGGSGPNLAGVMMAATDLAAKHFPYLYGGGHGAFKIAPVDCSGGVSYALHGGNMLGSPQTTDGLKVYGETGDGKAITIGVRGSTGRNAHTMMEIAGRFFESGSGHGWAQTSGWSGGFPIRRHPHGFSDGGVNAAILQEALAAVTDPSLVGWGLARGGTLPAYAGSFANGGMIPGPIGAPRVAEVHGGEVVVPNGMTLHADIYIGTERVEELVDVRLDVRQRKAGGTWDQGLR